MAITSVSQSGIYSVEIAEDELGGLSNLTNFELRFLINGGFQFKHNIQLNDDSNGNLYVNNAPAEADPVTQFNKETNSFNLKIAANLTPADFRTHFKNLLYSLELKIGADGVPYVANK